MKTKNILMSTALGLGLMLLLFGLLKAQPAFAGGVIYVDKAATGSEDGSSWSDAYTQLQDALGSASSGDEVWVASGVYTPGAFLTSTFVVTPGVALYGGFAGTETSRNQRDWKTNLTILSGDIDGNDVNTDGNFIAETASDIVGDNAYHVLWLDGVTGDTITKTTVVDGFTITAGSAVSSYPHEFGGGLYCNGRGSSNECSPTLANLTFSGNWANTYGGGMYSDGRNNGVCNASLTNITFRGNSSGTCGGGMHNRGNGGEISPNLVNVSFVGNQADYGGGGLFNDGNGTGESSPTLVNVLFSGNQAEYGGGMYNYGAWSGGESSPKLINVTFSGNYADYGGGMYNSAQNGSSSPEMINVIVWGNKASGSGNQLYNFYASPVLSYTLIQSGTNDIYNDNSTVTYGADILTVDPQFVAPITATAAPTTAGNYHLLISSLAVDAGCNTGVTITLDLDGNPRNADGNGDGNATVDMGAFEKPRYYLFIPFVER